jgi:hypothetical protein
MGAKWMEIFMALGGVGALVVVGFLIVASKRRH